MEKSFDFGKLLKNHEKKHKNKPPQFRSVAGGVQKRLETNLKNRKSSRLSIFDSIRSLQRCESPAPVSAAQQKVEHRRQQLEKWKEEKAKKKKEAATQKKKPFLVGVPHASLKFAPPPPSKPVPSTCGRVTRSQSSKISSRKVPHDTKMASQSFAPKNASFKPPALKNAVKLLSLAPVKSKKNKTMNITFDPVLPKDAGRQTRSKTQIQTDTKSHKKADKFTKSNGTKPTTNVKKHPKNLLQSTSSSESDSLTSPIPAKTRKSIVPSSPIISQKTPRKYVQQNTKNVTPKNSVPKSESSSEEKLRSPKSFEEVPMTPEQIAEEAKKYSPCVTMSRGKDNARREMKKKLDEGLLAADASNMESVAHFRRQLAAELERMTNVCAAWDKISDATALPDPVQEAVLGAVGQARLLMSQKLQQFAALLERCARPEPGAALVTPADLHGFWDMVFMQVENVDMRFKKLEEWRARGWAEPQEPARPPPARPPPARPARPARAAARPAAPSRLREMIAAARKAKKEQESSPQPGPVVVAPTEAPPAGEPPSKTFEAGFFCVRSPVRSPIPAAAAHDTPARHTSLLKAVLSSEAKKASASKNSASFAMLRASVLGKNVECEGITLMPQTPVNLSATPGRSILKGTNSKSGKKSIKVVLFDQSDTETTCLTPDSDVTETREKDVNTDSGLSSMDVEKVEDKENSKRKSRLVRQDAEDRSPVMTRSRGKSMNTPVEDMTPRRSRKSVLTESEDNVTEKGSPKRSSRRRKSGVQNKEG